MVWAAQLLRRPVKWTATRTETFLSDAQARDHDTTARMGFDRDGRIVAMQIDTLAALGGYLSNFAPSIPGNSYPQTVTGLYKTPNLHLRVRGVYTNTVPVDAYRGSGRPEATWTNERLIERGARELGIDVVEMRRRNLIARGDFPYPAPGGRVYDSGDPPALLDRLLAVGGLRRAAARAGRLRSRGVLMGIGLAAFIDKAGTGPSANLAKRGGLHGGWESAIVRVHSDGKVTIIRGQSFARAGTRDHVLPDRGRPPGAADRGHRLVEGRYRSGAVRQRHLGRALGLGGGDGGLSRRRQGARQGAALRRADCSNARRATSIMRRGTFTVRGTDRSIALRRGGRRSPITARCCRPAARPASKSTEFYDPPDTNDPQAIHLAVVVVDAETGDVRLRALYAADDCGVVINPMIVEGQVHGGLAQGIGQALTRTHRLRPRVRTASDRELSRLRHAAGGRSSRVPHHLHRDAGAEQSARRQGRKRERRDRRARGDRQRGDRCAVASRRARHHLADHVGNRMARAARGVPGRRATDA